MKPFWKYVKSREQDNIEALGRDNIPNRVLKQCVDHLAPALTIIFQRPHIMCSSSLHGTDVSDTGL
jgi:hypothetical protein